MSHIVSVDTCINDLDALKVACKALEFNFHENQTGAKYYGDARESCAHAITVPGAAFEIAVKAAENGWHLAYDPWESGGLSRALGGKKAERLVQAYAVEKVRKEMARKGYRMTTSRKGANGEQQLVFAGGR